MLMYFKIVFIWLLEKWYEYVFDLVKFGCDNLSNIPPLDDIKYIMYPLLRSSVSTVLSTLGLPLKSLYK